MCRTKEETNVPLEETLAIGKKLPELTVEDAMVLPEAIELSKDDVPIRAEFTPCAIPGVGIIVPMGPEELTRETR